MHQEDKTDNYAIDVQNLTKKFGDFTAVDNISFSNGVKLLLSLGLMVLEKQPQ